MPKPRPGMLLFDLEQEVLDGGDMDPLRKVNVNEGEKKGNVERWLLEVQDSE